MSSEYDGGGPPSTRAPLAVAIAIGVVVAALYAVYGWRQWESLFVPSWDLGIFSQLAQAYSGFDAPIVPIKGAGFNLLGDHFHPLLVLTGPVWALWPSGLSLLVLQAALFGLSAVPLTRLAIERWGMAFGAVLGVAYGLAWGLQSALVSQFHEIAFAVPLLAFSLTAYLRARLLAAAIWAGALVFVKEDLGLTVAALGLVIALRPLHRDDPTARRIGYGLAAWGVAWLVLATAVILPLLNPHDQYDYTGRIGNPLEFFLPPIKWLTVAMLAATAGVVGLRSPLMLLMVPTLAWRFVGNVEFYWGWMFHYSAILMPVAFAALLDSLERWPRRRDDGEGPARASSSPADAAHPAPPDAANGPGHAIRRTAPAAVRWGALAVSVLTTIGTIVWADARMGLSHQQPLSALADPAFYEASPRWEDAHEVMARIPEGAIVSTDISLMAYLVPHAEVRWLGNPDPPADYVLVDLEGYHFRGTGQASAEALAEDTWGVDYSPFAEVGGYAVVVRSDLAGAPSPTMEP